MPDNPHTPEQQQRAWDVYQLALMAHHEAGREVTPITGDATHAIGVVLDGPRPKAKLLFLAHYRKPTWREWVRNIYADYFLQLDHPGFIAGGSKSWI